MNFSRTLIDWYGANHRDLPWRRTTDPYKIWVSEIILQQTRVEQGINYYRRFVSDFPGITALASAPEDEVLKVWQGLGYYSRARNMMEAARQMVQDHNASFPDDFESIRKLKGIGDYTAAAVASIAFDLPYPVVDGNVYRLISRYKGIIHPVGSVRGKKEVTRIAGELMDENQPGIFNQAMMEFGAVFCKPQGPRCHECPFKKDCHAFNEGMTASLPVRKETVTVRKRFFHYFIVISGKPGQERFFIRKRPGGDIWEKLYDFPLIEKNRLLSFQGITKSQEWKELAGDAPFKLLMESEPVRHILSHRELIVRFFLLRSPAGHLEGSFKVSRVELDRYPVPRLIDRFIRSGQLEKALSTR